MYILLIQWLKRWKKWEKNHQSFKHKILFNLFFIYESIIIWHILFWIFFYFKSKSPNGNFRSLTQRLILKKYIFLSLSKFPDPPRPPWELKPYTGLTLTLTLQNCEGSWITSPPGLSRAGYTSAKHI